MYEAAGVVHLRVMFASEWEASAMGSQYLYLYYLSPGFSGLEDVFYFHRCLLSGA